MGLLVHEAQVFGVELLETVFSSSPAHEAHVQALWCVQKELGLSYIPELSTLILSLLVTLIQTELEHEQLSILKLLLFLLKWKSENDAVNLNEELLFVFPVINLVSSPSKSVKQAAIDLLSILEKLLINLLVFTEEGTDHARDISIYYQTRRHYF